MSERLTEEKCLQLLKQYHTPSHVVAHCRAVSDTAVAIGSALNRHGCHLNLQLIKTAGLVHDIARVEEHHERVGADLLEQLGYKMEADIVRVHMTYDFNPDRPFSEADMVCLGDRLVKENQYVGLDERVNYLINKGTPSPERTARLLEKKEETRGFIAKIEKKIGCSVDSLFVEGK